MNFLAHIYLSGDNELVKIGNFMADGIHGHKPEDFQEDIKTGILLHRAIDSFTDKHPIFRQGTKRLHPSYHHYAGVIVDIFYDHFLAKNWQDYHNQPLEDFAEAFYESLQEHYHLLTDRIKGLMPHMIKGNWLTSYASLEGIGRILAQMDHRTKHRSGMGNSVKELEEFYGEFEQEFTFFFGEVKEFAATRLEELQS